MVEPVTQIRERPLSLREREQLELRGERTQAAVDAVDDKWDEIMATASMIKDFHTALKNNQIPESIAYNLIPAAVKLYIARGGK